jgi:hypothetical protein
METRGNGRKVVVGLGAMSGWESREGLPEATKTARCSASSSSSRRGNHDRGKCLEAGALVRPVWARPWRVLDVAVLETGGGVVLEIFTDWAD